MISGNTSCSQDLLVALKFALKDFDLNKISVLFAIYNQNFVGLSGIRMLYKGYLAYQNENELLMIDNCEFYVPSLHSRMVNLSSLAVKFHFWGFPLPDNDIR